VEHFRNDLDIVGGAEIAVQDFLAGFIRQPNAVAK
jgi:hypothetical protein